VDTRSVYMDVCCLNRPYDKQFQHRVSMESEAVLSILQFCQAGRFELVYSDVISLELSQLSDRTKRQRVQSLCSVATRYLRLNPDILKLSETFQAKGVKLMDSLHLATAETFEIDVLLTTDDRFERKARYLDLKTHVINPVIWSMEVLKNER